MSHHKKFLTALVAKGGPCPEEYYDLDAWIIEVSEQVKTGVLKKEELCEIVQLFGEAFSAETMQGFAFRKPHGYAGDFEIIDRIYQSYVSSQIHLSRWDIYWQRHAAADAVRNRVHYLHNLLKSYDLNSCETFEVLNLASGPGRDLLHFLERNRNANIHFDCVEQDGNAIKHASELCNNYLDKITFFKRNALRFSTSKKFNLVWSAGLFDYFDDQLFSFMAKRLVTMVKPGGEIVIGNFSTMNPSKPYMELFEWNLHHRSPNTLKEIAIKSNIEERNIQIKKEETGVNLFLHIKA